MRLFLYHVGSRVLFHEPVYAETVFRIAKDFAGIEYRIVEDDVPIAEFRFPMMTFRNKLVEAPEGQVDAELEQRFEAVIKAAIETDDNVYREKELARLHAAGLNEYDFPAVTISALQRS